MFYKCRNLYSLSVGHSFISPLHQEEKVQISFRAVLTARDI